MIEQVTTSAHAVQGLTCFHDYQDCTMKTLSVDMLYSSLASFSTRTTVWREKQSLPRPSYSPGANKLAGQKYLDGLSKINLRFNSLNSFDADVGLASSASGFACLASAASTILGLSEEEKEVSKLARLGSFSAAASVVGGISVVRSAGIGQPTFGELVFSSEDMNDLQIVVAFAKYNKNGYDYYKEASTSPLLDSVRAQTTDLASKMILALERRDIEELAFLSERHAVLNYSVLQSGNNLDFLVRPETVQVINTVREMRARRGLPVFFSMNTGANVFLYCFSKSACHEVEEVLDYLGIRHARTSIGKPVKVEQCA